MNENYCTKCSQTTPYRFARLLIGSLLLLVSSCGTEPSRLSDIDGNEPDANDAFADGTLMDISPEDVDALNDVDVAQPQDGRADSDTDARDAGDIDAASDVDVDSAASLDAEMPDEVSDAETCSTVDPCGGCADDTFIPDGTLGAPCGPCANSALVCRDGLSVCDMSACTCSGHGECSESEACTAGVCAPTGWAYVAPAEYAKGCTDAYECSPQALFIFSSFESVLSRGLLVRITEEPEESWQGLMGPRVVYPNAATGLPAVFFTFDEVATYLNFRSEEAGLEPCYTLIDDEPDYTDEWPLLQACNGWRLPTEAEWEYFTRAGTDTRTWAGNPRITDWFDKSKDPLLDPFAYYFGWVAPLFEVPEDAYDCWTAMGDRPEEMATMLSDFPACRPVPVGERDANPWGLHDVFGNVLELVWDREGDHRDYGSGLDPIRPSDTSTMNWSETRARQALGGFFGDPASNMQYLGAYRYRDDRPNLHVGFRAVRSLPGVRLGRTVEPR